MQSGPSTSDAPAPANRGAAVLADPHIAAVRSELPQKNPQPGQRPATKAELKTAGIAEYIAANPRAGDSAVARKLGVHRKTVAKVRAAAGALPRDGRRRRRAAPDRDRASAPPVGPSPYSSEEAKAAAEELKAARARMTEQDWHLVVREIGGAL